jgi:hypothetical protein
MTKDFIRDDGTVDHQELMCRVQERLKRTPVLQQKSIYKDLKISKDENSISILTHKVWNKAHTPSICRILEATYL